VSSAFEDEFSLCSFSLTSVLGSDLSTLSLISPSVGDSISTY